MAYIIGDSLNNFLRGGHFEHNTIFGLGGDDQINGGDKGNLIGGGAGEDTIAGGTGGDHIYGGMDADHIYAGAGWDILSGGSGADLLMGDAGNDVMWGEWGDDFLFGGQHDDRMSGGQGKDHLQGDDGNDVMAGGAQADVFVFNTDEGRNFDQITDFEAGVDVIHLQSANVDGMEDIGLFQNGEDAMVSFEDDVLILKNVQVEDLTADSFHFEDSTLYL